MFTIFACSRFREQIEIQQMKSNQLVETAIETLQKTQLIKGNWKPFDRKAINIGLDGQIEIEINNKTIWLNVVIKTNLRSIHLPLLFKLAQKHAPLILIADQIFPKIKEELRNNTLSYLEANGNIWLKYDQNLIWIDSNKSIPKQKEKTNRAFTKTGLKVLFDFLRDETLINSPYREIANQADVALGNVSYILNGLKEMGYVVKLNKEEYKFINHADLLHMWVVKYAEKLKPELEIGNFRFLNEEAFLNWKNLKIKKDSTCWGSEPAGNLMTNYLKPSLLTLYTTETKSELIKNYKLIPDPNGKILVYKKFWKSNDTNEISAPPLLVYADLMNTGDHRCIETAQKIYNELFKDKL
jgi:hypothetical protein